MERDILSNIPRLYAIKIAKWFMLFMPIVVLFYGENGLEMLDIMLLKGIYSVAIVLFEIPSGYFADVWGRKKTMIVGSIMGTLGFVIYSFSHGFWPFLVAELTLGIGQSFISGSDSALLYDTLLKKKREKEYVKMEGRVISIGNFAETIAAIAGGLLAEYSLRSTFVAQIFIAAIAIPAALTLIEPSSMNQRKGTLKEILKIVRWSLWDDKVLRNNIFFSSVIGTSTLTFAWFIQPFLKEIGLSESHIGFTWAALNLTVAAVTLYAYKIEKRLGKVFTIIMITFVIALGYMGVGWFQSYWAFVFLFLFYIIRGVATPVLKDYINRITTSEIRATVLSVRNFVIRFLFALIGPFLGWLTDTYSLGDALKLAGLIFFVLSILVIIPLILIERKTSSDT